MRKSFVIFILLSLTFALFGQNIDSYQTFDKIFKSVLRDYINVDSLDLKKQLDAEGNLTTEYRINPNDDLKATIHYFGYADEKVGRIIEISNYQGQKLYEYILIDSNPLSTTTTFNKKGQILSKKETSFPGLGFYNEYVYEYGRLVDTINRPLVFDKTHNFTIDDIYGPWWNDAYDNAVLAFYRDSVFYVDNLENYKYELRDDSLIIEYGDYIDRGFILRVTNDSLFYKNGFDIINKLSRTED